MAAFSIELTHATYVTPSWNWVSTERQQYFILHIGWSWLSAHTSAKCNLVRKPYTTLPHTLVALTTASKYSQMLPAPTGALQSAFGLCKSILTCSSKHPKWWRCIQDATRVSIRILKLWSCWDHCASLRETSRGAETAAHALRETWCHIFTPVDLGFLNHTAFHRSYWSLLQSQESQHHNMACNI